MSVRPDLTVAAVIEHRGRFLFVEEQVSGELVINQPAGHLEPGESLFDAVRREVTEETAWCFRPEALVGLYLWTHPDSGQQFLRTAFCGTCFDHDPDLPLDDGIQRAIWLTREQLVACRRRHRSPMVLRCVEDYLKGVRLPLDLITEVDPDEVPASAVVV